jgi:hypothetical protein
MKESVEFTEQRCMVHEKGRINGGPSPSNPAFVESGGGGSMEEVESRRKFASPRKFKRFERLYRDE